jgi:seryl-tRNA synthetase
MITCSILAELTRAGLCWDPSGHAGLTGPLLELADDCDRAFQRLAGRWRAVEERHPAMLPARHLETYLRAFPHQATFPVALDPADDNLADFADGPVVGSGGDVTLTRRAPVSQVLTPAACYHLYVAHRGEALAAPQYLTTRNTCFRQERRYEPLRRQCSFSMREIVCLGTEEETAAFLEAGRGLVDRFAALIGLPFDWVAATDPFFRPGSNPAYLLQRVQPTKHEATYAGSLAIGSVNQHHDHFGAAFGITRRHAPAASACIAFGIERWLFALTDRYGTGAGGWPDLTAAATRAVRG